MSVGTDIRDRMRTILAVPWDSDPRVDTTPCPWSNPSSEQVPSLSTITAVPERMSMIILSCPHASPVSTGAGSETTPLMPVSRRDRAVPRVCRKPSPTGTSRVMLSSVTMKSESLSQEETE